MSEVDGSYEDVRRAWVEDAKFIWYIQEYLLQTYRNYLIVLQSVLVAAEGSLVGFLEAQIGNLKGILNSVCHQMSMPVDLDHIFPILIGIFLLVAIASFGFWSLASFVRIIDNRAANATVAQHLIAALQNNTLFSSAISQATSPYDKISLNLVLVMIEQNVFNDKPFGLSPLPDEISIAKYLFRLKQHYAAAFNRNDPTRVSLSRIVRSMFAVIWVIFAVYCAALVVRALLFCYP